MIEEKNDMQMDFDEDAQYTERKRILFFGLPWTFTKYIIKPSVITVDAGLFKIEENDCYMYKVQDVNLMLAKTKISVKNVDVIPEMLLHRSFG